MTEIFYIILFLIPILFIAIKFEKQIKWLLTPLILVKNLLDADWWADLIGEKSGAYAVSYTHLRAHET